MRIIAKRYSATLVASSALAAAIAIGMASAGTEAGDAKFTRLAVPGAVVTCPFGINDAAAVAGSYLDTAGNYHGFLRARDGDITTFDAPGAGAYTGAIGINNKGTIAGNFTDSNGINHGFIRSAAGYFVTVDPPGSIDTTVLAINVWGAVAGIYVDASDGHHGFTRDANGAITPFDPSGSRETVAESINASGVITGIYYDANEAAHGFVRAPDGTITSFDAPGAWEYTTLDSVNDSDDMAGIYHDENGNLHSFELTRGGTFTEFDVPNAISTGAMGINDRGEIAGIFEINDTNARYVFVRGPNGAISTYSPPQGGTLPETTVAGMNDKAKIVGWTSNGSHVKHSKESGFILKP
jgi:hypothetical protein